MPSLPEPAPSPLFAPPPVSELAAVASARAAARAFARREVAPRALRVHREAGGPHALGAIDWAFVRAARDAGLLWGLVPGALGGGGRRSSELAAETEELCAACGGLGLLLGANSLGLAGPLFALDADVWWRVVAPAARDRSAPRPPLFAWAITESGSGTEVQDARGMGFVRAPLRATRVPGGYRLDGRKVFTSNGSVARHVCVHAAIDGSSALEGWTAFVVDTRTPGFTAVRDEHKLGQRASPATEIAFEGVHVPTRDRLGSEGAGFALTELILAASRGPVGAIAIGIARGALEAAIGATRRLRPEHPCSVAQPWVRDRIGDASMKLAAGRLAYLDATSGFDRDLMPPARIEPVALHAARLAAGVVPSAALKRASGKLLDALFLRIYGDGSLAAQLCRASSAKALCADLAMEVCDRMCELVPPDAPERELVDKALCDVKLTQIYEGTNQLNRLTVADVVLGRRPAPRA
ncbi:MAG: acyl-CoA/acyl-ACP dehydrogenase [Polyangiaceae bacterium]|nr:acyl-CoA/acyl-ACP dehydrogenase [Polyangiaceae bacterium]